MTAARVLLLLFAVSRGAASCGRLEYLTSAPWGASRPPDESFEDCVRRLRGDYAPAGLDEVELARTLRDQCGLATCSTACTACVDDTDCEDGQLCDAGICSTCPDISDCPVPEAGLVLLSRHGCPVCVASPPSECSSDGDCAAGTCHLGAQCAPGCNRLDCCANVCTSGDCDGPAPLGCFAICGLDATEPYCFANACECLGGRWYCESLPTKASPGGCIYSGF